MATLFQQMNVRELLMGWKWLTAHLVTAVVCATQSTNPQTHFQTLLMAHWHRESKPDNYIKMATKVESVLTAARV